MNKKDQEALVRKIRTQYIEKEEESNRLDDLKTLDKKVKKPANVFAFVFGSISALVMGSGMSLVMTDIGSAVGIENALFVGIAVGVAGLCMAIVNYPMYKGILGARKKKYASEIIALSDKLLDD